MNKILTEHLKGVLAKNNFQILFKKERKKEREKLLYKQRLLFLFCKPLQLTNHLWNHSGTLPGPILAKY